MSTIQELLVGALRKSGHAVAILDRELKICWEGGMPRAMIGAPVNILWQGAKMARREAMKVLRCLASGNACQTTGQGKKAGRDGGLILSLYMIRQASCRVLLR